MSRLSTLREKESKIHSRSLNGEEGPAQARKRCVTSQYLLAPLAVLSLLSHLTRKVTGLLFSLASMSPES